MKRSPSRSGLATAQSFGLDTHRTAQRDEGPMEARDGTDALEDDGLGIIEQPLPGHAAEGGGPAHERAAQRVDGQIEHELAPHRA
jgi:hypothetical protein